MLCGIEAWKPLTWIQRAALERADRVMAISGIPATVSRGERAVCRPRDRVCRLGVEATRSGRRRLGPLSLRADRRPDGRRERYKGHDLLLDVWADVVREVPGAALRIVGDGDDRPTARAQGARAGPGGQIAFLGRVTTTRSRAEYERCTAFVMPSRDKGSGFVFVEAMRAARACVASRGAAAGMVVDGESGLVVDPAIAVS